MVVNRDTLANRALVAILVAITGGCAPAEPAEDVSSELAVSQRPALDPEELMRQLDRIDRAAAGIDSIFQPLPLLTPAREEALRSYTNAQQLERARSLGVGRNLSDEELSARLAEGRLVTLEDSDFWVVRDLDYSSPYVVPGVTELLSEVGTRFQARLAELGAPPFRLEVSSVLRSATDQAELRRVNPNAAGGESTHEYGTTVDVLYSAYSAPVEPIVDVRDVDDVLVPVLTRYAAIAAERVAARRSLELKAIVGAVLLELQQEGRVMVTLERQQPVFHMTVAR